MASNINMRGVQEGVEDSIKHARDLGHKAILATLGVAGLGFDLGKSIVEDSGSWVNKAECRGEEVEKQIFETLNAYQKDFPGEVKKLAHNIEEGVTAAAKEVNEQTERFASYVQKNVKSGAETVSETVVDIKVSAEKQAKKVVDSAEEMVDTVKNNGAAAVKSAKIDVAATAQEVAESAQATIDSAVDKVWMGYDDLGVKEILAGLDGKSMSTLEKVREHELAGKNRVTVIREIDAKMQAMTS